MTAELTITDNGPGIAPDLLKTLFQRFVRGDKARSRETDSTGLGLAIVSSIVDAHHGQASVESTQAGTTFRVRIPAIEPSGTATVTHQRLRTSAVTRN